MVALISPSSRWSNNGPNLLSPASHRSVSAKVLMRSIRTQGCKRPGTKPPNIQPDLVQGGRLTITVACIMPRRVLTYRLARFDVTVGIPPVSLRRIQTQSTWLTSAVLAPPQENGCARAGSPTREWLSLHDVAIQVPSETLVVLRHAEHRARRQRGGGGAEAKRASSATAQLACLLACFPP